MLRLSIWECIFGPTTTSVLTQQTTVIKDPEEQKPDLLPHDSARPHDQLGDMEGAGGDDVHLAQQPGVHLSVYLDNTDVFL